jgi:hypothetical protein
VPGDDVVDQITGARFYYHAHDPSEWHLDEHGHFHLFVASDAEPGFAHLVAVSMAPDGRPVRLFTTNEWVTGEALVPADALLAGLPDRFEINRARPSWLVGRWLTCLVMLTLPRIEWLLRERDRALAAPSGDWPDADVRQDRERHRLSELSLDLDGLLATWQARIAELAGPMPNSSA